MAMWNCLVVHLAIMLVKHIERDLHNFISLFRKTYRLIQVLQKYIELLINQPSEHDKVRQSELLAIFI